MPPPSSPTPRALLYCFRGRCRARWFRRRRHRRAPLFFLSLSLSLLLSLATTLAQWLVVGCWFYPSRNTCSVGGVVVRGLVVYSPDPNRRRETLTTRRMRASRDDAARRSLAPRASRLAPSTHVTSARLGQRRAVAERRQVVVPLHDRRHRGAVTPCDVMSCVDAPRHNRSHTVADSSEGGGRGRGGQRERARAPR